MTRSSKRCRTPSTACAALLLLACASPSASPTPTGPRPESPGPWGGPHVALVVTETGGRLEFDCAHATIEESFRVGPDGKFRLRGRYVRERPGPVREDEEESRGSPAEFTGEVSGDSMTMRVQVEDAARDVGPFRLIRGAAGRVFKCQ